MSDALRIQLSTKEGISSIRETAPARLARVSRTSGKVNSRQNDARTENGKNGAAARLS
jgi:hypothetical protein